MLGLLVGGIDGKVVGYKDKDGTFDGPSLGAIESVGTKVGYKEMVGTVDGLSLGTIEYVGSIECTSDGEMEGRILTDGDALTVGGTLGEMVGISVITCDSETRAISSATAPFRWENDSIRRIIISFLFSFRLSITASPKYISSRLIIVVTKISTPPSSRRVTSWVSTTHWTDEFPSMIGTVKFFNISQKRICSSPLNRRSVLNPIDCWNFKEAPLHPNGT